MNRIYIIDTSYLLELYQVPGKSDAGSSREVKKRFITAISDQARMLIPLGVLFELCNHIAGVANGDQRAKLSWRVAQDVEESCTNPHFPWRLTPADSLERLRVHIDRYAKAFAPMQIGLTDTQVTAVADDSKSKHSGLDYNVHIWTRDAALKAFEPDTEPDPFV